MYDTVVKIGADEVKKLIKQVTKFEQQLGAYLANDNCNKSDAYALRLINTIRMYNAQITYCADLMQTSFKIAVNKDG